MTPGDRMVRLEDGMAGVVAMVTPPGYPAPEQRIVFELHGERLIAGKQEKWVPADPGPLPLREEEKRAVAYTADRVLRSLVKHEPTRWWEPMYLQDDPFDAQLVKVIVDYLGTRT